MQNWKKKKLTLIFQYFGSVGQKRANKHFFFFLFLRLYQLLVQILSNLHFCTIKNWRRNFHLKKLPAGCKCCVIVNSEWHFPSPCVSHRCLDCITLPRHNLNPSRGGVGKVLSPEEGREGGWREKKNTHSAAWTQNLPQGRRESVAAHQGHCLDKLAFPYV